MSREVGEHMGSGLRGIDGERVAEAHMTILAHRRPSYAEPSAGVARVIMLAGNPAAAGTIGAARSRLGAGQPRCSGPTRRIAQQRRQRCLQSRQRLIEGRPVLARTGSIASVKQLSSLSVHDFDAATRRPSGAHWTRPSRWHCRRARCDAHERITRG